MIDEQDNPPRIAQMLLTASIPSRDADAIGGDLLEEYRAVRRPALGPWKAGAWYWAHVLSVVLRLVWPFAVGLVAARGLLAAFMLFPFAGRWNPSLVPAPNVSLLDALFFVAAGYYGTRRTGRLATGIVSAIALGLVDFAAFAVVATLAFPTLAAAIWGNPFILVIGSMLLAIAMAFAVVLGAAGAAVGGWTARSRTP